MIVIRSNTPDQVLEQTILSLLQQAQIDAEQILRKEKTGTAGIGD